MALVALAAATRLLPHPANFTAIGAIALFSGAYLPRRWGIIAPALSMLATDAVIGFYTPGVRASVYASFAIVYLIGRHAAREQKFSRAMIGALASPIIFFFITNAAVWAFTPMYAKTSQGLFTCFAMAVPFFRNMLAGDLFYSATLFGIAALAQKFVRQRSVAVSV